MSAMLDRLCDELGLDAGVQASAAALIASGTSVPDALAHAAVAGGDAIALAMAKVLHLQARVQASEMELAAHWLTDVPIRIWAQAQALPVILAEQDPHQLWVATANPLDQQAFDTIRVACGGRTPELVVVPSDILQDMLREHLGVGADTVQSLMDGHIEEISVETDMDLADAAEDASIIRLVNQVLKEALERRATDVHFEPFEGRFAVRYRIDGILVEAKLPEEVRHLQAAIVSRLKILAQLDIAEKRLPQDGRIKIMLGGHEVDVRASIIPMLHGEAVVLRLLDRSAALVGLEGTGMSGRDLNLYTKALHLPHGIVLITGPTGSGKTTSLYAGLSLINTTERKIVTIEDPVEYHQDGINQIQVDTKTGLSFARGLRSILRHDPDVVLIGEIRDCETAEIAVQASLTGHLVLSTLHTNDAPGAVTRLIDMGIEPYLVASTLELVVAQRLVRLLCPQCKQALSGQALADARALLGDAEAVVYGPCGCRACNGIGFQGRSGIFESMAISQALRHATSEQVSSQELRRLAEQDGLQSLRADGLRLVRAGKTSIEEVLRNTHDGSLME